MPSIRSERTGSCVTCASSPIFAEIYIWGRIEGVDDVPVSEQELAISAPYRGLLQFVPWPPAIIALCGIAPSFWKRKHISLWPDTLHRLVDYSVLLTMSGEGLRKQLSVYHAGSVQSLHTHLAAILDGWGSWTPIEENVRPFFIPRKEGAESDRRRLRPGRLIWSWTLFSGLNQSNSRNTGNFFLK